MMTFFETFLEGMDTPEGAIPGVMSYASIIASFFPMANSLRSIFPPPVGWHAGEAAALSAFVCLAIKTFMHTFGRTLKYDARQIQTCGVIWILVFCYHYMNKADQYTQDHDPIVFLFYGALFALPTFAFSAMQIHAARRTP